MGTGCKWVQQHIGYTHATLPQIFTKPGWSGIPPNESSAEQQSTAASYSSHAIASQPLFVLIPHKNTAEFTCSMYYYSRLYQSGEAAAAEALFVDT